MTPASKYWKLVSLTGSGKTKVQEISLAKEFLWKEFPDLKEEVEVSDSFLQKQLVEFNFAKDRDYIKDKIFAQFCLRCYISHQIELVCLQLEQKFGGQHNFSRYDILPLVLEDTPDNFRVTSRKPQSSYKPLSVKILETFNIQKATLSTWVTRLVKQYRELNLFLLEKGVYLISDWAILNDTSTKLVKRVLREFHNLSEIEISRASILLASYHSVYRQDRLKQRQAGVTSKCKPPTQEQLQKIASLIEEKNNSKLNPETVLSKLQDLANLLREYRLYVRGGKAKFEQSFDAIPGSSDRIQAREENLEDNQQEQREFLTAYRQQFLSSLDIAIETVVKHKYNYLAKKKGKKEQHFLKGLHLFHCQGKSMGEIAPLIDLTAQYQVTRLLKLKELRADIRQKLLQELRDRTLSLAKKYSSISELEKIELQLETALTERIDTVMQEAETEASIPKNRACSSVFASRLCQYLKSKKLAVQH